MAIRLLLMAGAPAVPNLNGGADVDRSTSQPAKWKGMCCCHEKTLHVVCTVASVYLRLSCASALPVLLKWATQDDSWRHAKLIQI